ncbi:MAG: hypothetical protein OXH84_07400 [Gammaproteobacteria bacterium]|nr:hypothetical protein [Gammaproteobacteria bacterium]
MNPKDQAKLDRATKAMLGLGALPDDYKDVKPTRKDKDRKFRMQVRRGKAKIVECET